MSVAFVFSVAFKKITGVRVIAVEIHEEEKNIKAHAVGFGRMCLRAFLPYYYARAVTVTLTLTTCKRTRIERAYKRKTQSRSFGFHLPVELADRLSLLLPSWNAEWCICAQVSSDAWRSVAVCYSLTSSLRLFFFKE